MEQLTKWGMPSVIAAIEKDLLKRRQQPTRYKQVYLSQV